MVIKIRWIDRNVIQVKELVKCRPKEGQFSMNSPIYEAIENGSFILDAGYGKHKFEIEEL
jgi:hypothetical protein